MTVLGSLVSDTTYEPLVTIAIPTFNRAALLQDCIAATLNQSYKNLEVLVSDNASTDETTEILKRFSDRRLRVVRQEQNIGILRNLNALLQQARGEFVVFVPDDDRIAPCMLERCVALTRREPEISIIVALCDVWFVAQGRTWQAPGNQRLGTGIWDGAEILYEYLKDRISAAMCSIMYRTEMLRARGGFPLNFPYAADIASWAPLLLEGRAGLVNESCATIALHGVTQTSNLAIDVRVSDGRNVVDLIASAVDKQIEDQRERRKIKIESQRHFARRTVNMLTLYRRQGAVFLEVVQMVWRLRQDIMKIGMRDIGQLTRLFVILLLPAPIARWIRYAVRLPQSLRLGAAE